MHLNILNERGGALVIVLFILMLFTVLGYSIAAYTMQSSTQHAISEDEVQGKMLADLGLAYFQEYLENKLSLSTYDTALKNPSGSDSIIILLDEIALPMTSDTTGPFRRTLLAPASSGGAQQGFAIGYQMDTAETIPFRTETSNPDKPYSQPYVRKLKVSVIGLPVRANNNVGIPQRMVRLDATVYINTIPAPFHYAVSTPGELRLFGGTNLIGNSTAHHIVTSSEYRYNTGSSGDFSSGGKEDYSKSYVEGTVTLSDRISGSTTVPGIIYNLSDLPRNALGNPDAPKHESMIPSAPESTKIVSSRAELRTAFIPIELESTDERSVLSAPSAQPYLPGYEAPIVEHRNETAKPLFSTGNVSSFVRQKLVAAGSFSRPEFLVNQTVAIKFDDNVTTETSLRDVDVPSGTNTIVIQQDYTGVDLSNPSDLIAPLTARLTGTGYGSINQLFVGVTGENPTGNKEAKATVEMGCKGAFISPPTPCTTDGTNDPFTYTGTIYIKGNLDIVGDIKVNGTIYVDGDVLIREISNLDNQNLAIIASGAISTTSRYLDNSEGWNKTLTAFLYSERSMEIFSIESINRIEGGIATGIGTDPTAEPNSYIEFNTKREGGPGYASHLTIQFNRRIFEQETPGLPPGDEFFLDLYDLNYITNPGQVDIR
ncbi:hypothetical protein [Brevibacillus sp. SYSU BS000544]|uniref:hypothetical protein n=1 Tax=Brevibacillus sp. SYSU BS000544 TaxID=3416443 RepID=UPI003CE46BC6